MIITIIVLLILAGVTIAALTGSDSTPIKANEAAQKNDIGTAKDDVVLTAVNAQNSAYETAYVANGVAAGDASQLVGKSVVKALYEKYGASTQMNKATISIEVGGSSDASNLNAITSGDIIISTTDFELTGEVDLSGGVITWGEIEQNVPAEVSRVELNPTILEIGAGKSKTVEVKCYNSSNQLIPTRKLGNISISRKSGSDKITVIPDLKNKNRATINVASDQEIGNNIAVITAIVEDIEAVAEKRCTINVQDYYITNDYTWTELSAIAKLISDQYGAETNSINNTDESATVTYNSKQVTLNVGDKAKLKYNGTEKVVRIIGFNHDDLESSNAYVENGTNIKAGITFEFVDIIGKGVMKSGYSNSEGWKSSVMCSTLNNTSSGGTYLPLLTDLSTIPVQLQTNIIKSVKKPYIAQWNNETVTTPTIGDKLWLFSCGELWGSKQQSKSVEGSQYKLYTLGQSKIKKERKF